MSEQQNGHYVLLTPGPLSTSVTVKQAMLKDWCTWDDDYTQGVVEAIRCKLVTIATRLPGYTCALMQGSGTASVEATIGSVIPNTGKLLVIDNGAYGARIVQIARYLNIPCHVFKCAETAQPDLTELRRVLEQNNSITHVAVVHCETTTGMLNPIAEVIGLAREFNKRVILDAMSSFGGIPMDIGELGVDFMISSANKCIQGVPGFGFVIAKQAELEQCEGRARSLCLDLYDQWRHMEDNKGKWRFTSPTHTVRAFHQALQELEDEGGVQQRYQRYSDNQKTLVQGMKKLGFTPLLADELHSPIITSFYSPQTINYSFKRFYDLLKSKGFVIYPGKVSNADCFRIGNIGEVYQKDILQLLVAIEEYVNQLY